jgi:ectoine utilization protein EutD
LTPGFAPEELDARLRHVRERMAARGIDTLLVSDPANMHYLTGYDGWSFYTPQGVVVPAEGDVVLFTRFMDAAGARMTTALGDEQILGFPDDYVQQPDRHPLEWVARELTRRGAVGRTVALEMDAYYFTPRAYNALRASLPEATFVDAHELVNWVRAVKSPAELERMRTAARIAERVMAAGIEAVQPGVRQCDAVAAIYDAALRGADGAGGDYPAVVPMLPSGPGTATPHLTWTDEPFNAGEATVLELAGCHRRYHCPMARTVFLGRPPRRLLDTAAATRDGLEAALAAVRPGVRCEQIEAAWRREIAKHGLEKESRIGYSVGLNYPPDWGEHTMSLRPGDTTELEPGMTFHMIVGMWMDGWGFELSETFHVTPGGAECLSSFPRELAVKE